MATPARPRGVKWDVVNRKAAVVVAPITAKNEFVLVRQERIPVRQALWEFRAGRIEAPGGQATSEESIILATAVRELQEEAGYRLRPGGRWERLGFCFTSPAFTDEHCHFLATIGVEAGSRGQSARGGRSDCRMPRVSSRRIHHHDRDRRDPGREHPGAVRPRVRARVLALQNKLHLLRSAEHYRSFSQQKDGSHGY